MANINKFFTTVIRVLLSQEFTGLQISPKLEVLFINIPLIDVSFALF